MFIIKDITDLQDLQSSAVKSVSKIVESAKKLKSLGRYIQDDTQLFEFISSLWSCLSLNTYIKRQTSSPNQVKREYENGDWYPYSCSELASIYYENLLDNIDFVLTVETTYIREIVTETIIDNFLKISSLEFGDIYKFPVYIPSSKEKVIQAISREICENLHLLDIVLYIKKKANEIDRGLQL